MPDQPMNLTPGCTVCEHNAETLGVDMPKADAADALAAQLAILNTDRARRAVAEVSLAFIRDAIHRDGPDADAIREALGFTRDIGYGVLASELGILVSTYDGTAKRHERWRLLTAWREVP